MWRKQDHEQGGLEGMLRDLRRHGIRDPNVLEAMARVPRHRFIPADRPGAGSAYGDHPLPIGYGQTISQPFIVAYMTERLGIGSGSRVLDIGTGSGYQAAVLAELGARVYSLEIVPELAVRARALLDELGYDRVEIRLGNGFAGWPDEAPFDGIVAACAPPAVPPALPEQLVPGARLILPVGVAAQRLVIVTRRPDGSFAVRDDLPVRFVPMLDEGAASSS